MGPRIDTLAHTMQSVVEDVKLPPPEGDVSNRVNFSPDSSRVNGGGGEEEDGDASTSAAERAGGSEGMTQPPSSSSPSLADLELDRSRRDLTTFPTPPSPDSITHLQLQRNRLSLIPASVAEFSRLVHLDVSANRIHSLSSALCSLRHLRTLVIKNNALTDGYYDDDDDIRVTCTKIGSCPSLVREENNNKIIVIR